MGGGDSGYSIAFNSGEIINIINGKDGKNGTDGKSPDLSVKEDINGVYYWTVNGNFLTDDAGNKMPVTGPKGEKGDKGDQGDKGDIGDKGDTGAQGEKGQTGETGSQGESGTSGNHAIAPQLRISDANIWQISTDNGKTWKDMTDSKGNTVKATGDNGAQGENGVPGKDGDSFFQSVNTDNENYVEFTLKDGTMFTVPRGNAITIGFTKTDYYIQGSSLDVEVELAGITDDNVAAITAEVKGAEGSATAVYTRANDLKVEISDVSNSKAYINISKMETGNDYILKVTVVTKDGKETSATKLLRGLKEPTTENKEDGKKNYIVSTIEQWLWLTENYTNHMVDTVKLANDLDFNGMTINKPLGFYYDYDYNFTSSFDGCGHTIKNFVIYNNTDNNYTGLFGCLLGYYDQQYMPKIQNVTIENADVTGNRDVGILTGGIRYCAIIDNVIVKESKAESIGRGNYVGGICGFIRRNLTDEYVNFAIAHSRIENCTLIGKGKDRKRINEIVGGSSIGFNYRFLITEYKTWNEGTTSENVNIVVAE